MTTGTRANHLRWLRIAGVYGLAICLTAAAFFLRQALSVSFGERPLLILFMFPIVVSALLGGAGPGLLAVFLSAVLTRFFFIPPVLSFRIAAGHDALQWYMLILNGILVIALSEFLHRSRQRETIRMRELHREHELLQAVIDGAKNSHLVYLDPDFNFVRVNATYATSCGYTPEEMIGKNHFVLYPHAENEAIFTRVRDTGESFEVHDKAFEFPDQPERGATYWDWTLTPVKDPAGKVEGIVFSLFETTERKRNEMKRKELEDQNRRLQKAESLGRMAGAIAHHFNNQLAVVIGNLDLIMDDSSMDETTRGNLTEAFKAAVRAADLSAQMLTYLGQTKTTLEPTDFNGVCRTSLSLLRKSIPAAIRLEADVPNPGPTVNANREQLGQVVSNLVTNAWESCDPKRGQVHVSVKTISGQTIPKTNRYPADWQPQAISYACLEVRDSGCGIAETDIEKLFDPFFTTKFIGRGLGLAVTRGIMKAHGGGITVESKPGQGSTFRVFLPEWAGTSTPAPEDGAPAPEMKWEGAVLLVEDEEAVRKTSASLLQRLGFEVIEAKNGEEALDIFSRYGNNIRLVLCDLTMPRMTGWETLSALRNLAPGLVAILYSGHDEGQIMAGDHPVQPNAFLHKPFSRKGLAAAIKKVLAPSSGL